MSCPLAFRFSYIERRPSPPSIAATKGSIVHRALELLFNREIDHRTIENCHEDLEKAFIEYEQIPDLVDLDLDDIELKKLQVQSHELVDKYFQIENPKDINPIGLEVKLQAKVGSTTIRGVIDRLELDEFGELVVTDYKTGSPPRNNSESSKLSGVNLYALLCQEVFGRLPSKVQLIYIAKPVTIIATPTLGTLKGVQQRSDAIHKAVESACEKGDFRPNPSPLCSWCGYQELCPAKGGTLPDA
jgi:putative RecB family exonuclease